MFQGMVVWRARLKSTDLPHESHVFRHGTMAAMFYPISQGQFVWTVLAPASRLEEVGLALKTHSQRPQPSKGMESSPFGKPKRNESLLDDKSTGREFHMSGSRRGSASLQGKQVQGLCESLNEVSLAPRTPPPGSQPPRDIAAVAGQDKKHNINHKKGGLEQSYGNTAKLSASEVTY